MQSSVKKVNFGHDCDVKVCSKTLSHIREKKEKTEKMLHIFVNSFEKALSQKHSLKDDHRENERSQTVCCHSSPISLPSLTSTETSNKTSLKFQRHNYPKVFKGTD